LVFVVVAIVLFAAFVQTLSGFGFALMVMPLLTILVGLRRAAPLVALAGLTLYLLNLIRHRRALDPKEVLRLMAASVPGIFVGIWVLSHVQEKLVTAILGGVLILYAVYELSKPETLLLRSAAWAYPAGFVAGCLGGAYNTPGPPLVAYGSMRGWPKEKFRGILQAVFLMNASLVVTSHYLAHHITGQIVRWYLCSVPAVLVGAFVGSRLDGYLDRKRFRKLVTAMILLLGVSLIV